MRRSSRHVADRPAWYSIAAVVDGGLIRTQFDHKHHLLTFYVLALLLFNKVSLISTLSLVDSY